MIDSGIKAVIMEVDPPRGSQPGLNHNTPVRFPLVPTSSATSILVRRWI
jgi:hypothetical protein